MSTKATKVLHSPDKRIRLVSIAAAVLTVIGLYAAGQYLFRMLSSFLGESSSYPQTMLYPQFASNLTWCIFLITVLILLIRIAATGRAFTTVNVRILKTAGTILMLNLILPIVCEIAATVLFSRQDQLMSDLLITLIQSVSQYAGIYSIIMILLTALCREVVYYGTMLQTESDETV